MSSSSTSFPPGFQLELDALVRTRRLPSATATPIEAYANRVIDSFGR